MGLCNDITSKFAEREVERYEERLVINSVCQKHSSYDEKRNEINCQFGFKKIRLMEERKFLRRKNIEF